MKTETLQAKGEVTLAEWQVGAQWPSSTLCVHVHPHPQQEGPFQSGRLQGGKGFLDSEGLVSDLELSLHKTGKQDFKR